MDLNSFIENLDPNKPCPKCLGVFARVRQHARFCFKGVNDFSDFISGDANLASTSFSTNSCQICKKTFKGPVWLANHVRIKHSLPASSTSLKRKCQFENCSKFFMNLESKHYKNHVAKFHSPKPDLDPIQLIGENFFDKSEINEIGLDICDPDVTGDVNPSALPCWLQNISEMLNNKKFNFLHLNINSILGATKFTGLVDLVELNTIDLICVQESKIGNEVPDSLFAFNNYQIIRRDRSKGSGGIIIFLKKCYKVIYKYIDPVFETIVLILKIGKNKINFIFSYNPHFEYAADFNLHLEQQLQSINISNPTFIVGDLNQDLLSNRGDRLKCLMDNYSFNIDYDCPTHFHGKSKTLIDVVLSNSANVCSSFVLDCPFSNHNFVLSKSSFDAVAHNLSSITARVLNQANLDSIKNELKLARFEMLELLDDPGDRWHFLKLIILGIIDKFAPVKV
jgi:hypothetical protein